MKHTLKKLSDTKVELSVTLDATDLKAARQIALVRLAKDTKVPGFRVGKVPPAVAEKHLSPMAIENETLENAINTAVIAIFTKEDFQALDRPQVDVREIKPGESAIFTATAEILPEVKLGDYKNLKVTEEKVTVTDKDVTEVIDRMRTSFAQKNDVDRAAKDGDEVTIDFEGKDEKGELVSGAAGKDYPLTLGSNTFIPGFEEGIVGKKPGDTFTLPLTFPKDYHAEKLAGVKVNFSVTLKSVKEISLPKVDDEFAQKAGPFQTVAELKADIKRELTEQKQQASDDKLKDSLVEQLVKTSQVPVPEILVKDQMQNIERDTVQNLMYRGLTLEQYLEQQNMTHDEWHEKELKDAAERRVQAGLALAELSKAEGIEVTKDELDKRHQEMLEAYKDEQIRKQLDTPEARRDLANRELTRKTVERLVALNKKK
ncbi:MAG TPA: trigger factor [Verrucomicrobiae bacterium]|nr:trigger factor [Verrucomicrobiae bacterium]